MFTVQGSTHFWLLPDIITGANLEYSRTWRLIAPPRKEKGKRVLATYLHMWYVWYSCSCQAYVAEWLRAWIPQPMSVEHQASCKAIKALFQVRLRVKTSKVRNTYLTTCFALLLLLLVHVVTYVCMWLWMYICLYMYIHTYTNAWNRHSTESRYLRLIRLQVIIDWYYGGNGPINQWLLFSVWGSMSAAYDIWSLASMKYNARGVNIVDLLNLDMYCK